MSLKCNAAAYSHIGGRSNNEDNFFLNGVYLRREMLNQGGRCVSGFDEAEQIYAVCDGMGGALYGEEASLLAVESLKDYKNTSTEQDSSGNISRLLSQISGAINDLSKSRGEAEGGSGSTIAMLIIGEQHFRTVHVGDSRIYRLRDNSLERLTVDHSQVQMMLDAGEIKPEEAWRHPLKNIITQHLGMSEKSGKFAPAISQRLELMKGDKFLICSDGLSDAVRDEIIGEMMKSEDSPAESAEKLVLRAIDEAKEGGFAPDNITVVRIDVDEVGDKSGSIKKMRRLGIFRVTLVAAMLAVVLGMLWVGVDIVRYLLR